MNQYSLVIAVAKRARQIAVEAEQDGMRLTDKPVDLAVQDFVEDKYSIIEPEDLEG
jgi:DNA-directed RNA polymerase subunit omega